MKQISLFLGFVLVLITGIFAAAPTNSAVDGAYAFGGVEYTISGAAAFDTSVATDSITLLSGRAFSASADEGWEYILVRDAITGTGSDSVKLQVNVDALDGNGNLLYRTAVDSFTTSAGEAVSLLINSVIIGSKYRIKLIGYTGNGGQVILNRLHIMKRRPVLIHKNR